MPESTCTRCEAALPEGARFCMSCGQPVASASPANEETQVRLTASAPTPLREKMRAPRLIGERKPVTALLADVVGSTTLAESMDAEDWTAIMNGAFEAMSGAIHRYEGTIAKLVGDAVLAFFGAPVAHEDDPERAVRAALEMLDGVRDYSTILKAEHGIDFAVRIGLNSGQVMVGNVGSDLRYEYTALGDAVNVAARMQTAARPGTVLITEATYRFVAHAVDATDLGLIEVKGKTEPVRAYQVTGLRSVRSSARGLAGLESPMIGRDDALATLTRLLDETCAGHGRAAFILAEAGLGKSRLIAEFRAAVSAGGAAAAGGGAASGGGSSAGGGSLAGGGPAAGGGSAAGGGAAAGRGAAAGGAAEAGGGSAASAGGAASADDPPLPITWAQGHALSYGQTLPYHLLIDLVRSLVGARPRTEEPEVRAALDALIADLFPDVAPEERADTRMLLGSLLSVRASDDGAVAATLEPQTLAAGYLKALRRVFTSLAARGPLILVLEDIHWADSASVEAIVNLLPLLGEVPILLIAAGRPDRETPGMRLLAAAHHRLGAAVTEIPLEPLSEAESRELVAHLLVIESLPIAVRGFILARAEGNPFFVEEVIRMLIDRGAIVRDGENWRATELIDVVEIPDTLQGLLLARIDRLPDDARRALRVASVIGRQFSVRVLEDVLERSASA